ncbi:hypothetical protein Ctob_011485 [Chrysochromulina tobinii]|uniref:Uncharacterized protein n=1 Tax=Chrysochromulina tobinii TaxID=1460289 RepID=A0A0M0K758_9EUKA|nr:hypothetical protein Ctob_011485 [Chrysochromulina tobinii]|eukprot:KOO34634.1 hypothetical protein Ctob_011485 [Chrysochromulina sp. CCMP291]
MRAFMAQQQAQKEAALAHLNATLGTGGAQAGDEGLYAALGVVGRGAKQLPGTESTNTTRIAPERQVHGGGFFFSGGSDASPAQSEQAEHSVLMAANDDDMFMDDDNGGSFLGSDDGELSPTASEAAAVPATSPTSGSDHSYGDFAAMHAGPLLAAAPVLSKLVVEPGALTAQPVFVRSATGSILFCNFAATDAVGLPRGEWPQAWQITPQVVSPPYAPGVTSEMRGELDLLRDPVDQHDPVALPAPTSNFNVLLQNSRGIYQSMLCAHRIPFWMASSDNSGTKRAVVLYVGSG